MPCEKVQKTLDAANGKNYNHIIKYTHWLVPYAIRAEKHLESIGIPTKERIGARAYAFGNVVSKSYSYWRNSFEFYLERKSNGWHLSKYEVKGLRPKEGGIEKLILTPEQQQIAIYNFISNNFKTK